MEYIKEVLSSGKTSGDGVFTKKCSELIENQLGTKKAFLTTSGTHALEMAALLLEIKPGDEVLIPSFTFVSSINAFVLRGARPVFIDIRHDTLNMDEDKLEEAITSNTRAIVPVHYAGVGCEMDKILEVAKKHSVSVVEDNSHGLFAKYKGRYLGTFGSFAAQSFHETKNFSCGEGGAILVNDARYLEAAEILREKGTNRSSFFRGEVDKYSWISVGSSYLPSDILAALLYAQLEVREQIQDKRKKVWEFYRENLQEWAGDNEINLPYIPDYCEQAYHMFYIVLPTLKRRQALIEYLKSRNIASAFHYLPLHLSEMGEKFGGKKGSCPVTESLSERILRLPFYTDMVESDQARVVEAVTSFH